MCGQAGWGRNVTGRRELPHTGWDPVVCRGEQVFLQHTRPIQAAPEGPIHQILSLQCVQRRLATYDQCQINKNTKHTRFLQMGKTLTPAGEGKKTSVKNESEFLGLKPEWILELCLIKFYLLGIVKFTSTSVTFYLFSLYILFFPSSLSLPFFSTLNSSLVSSFLSHSGVGYLLELLILVVGM